jgi:cytochrome c2
MRGLTPQRVTRIFSAAAISAALACAACNHGHSMHFGSGHPREMREARALIAANCGACHRVPGVATASGRVGPALEGVSRQQIIAGHFANSPEAMTEWIEHPQRLLPGDAMPDTGLSHDEVLKIVDYLYTMESQ